ncbi:flavin reductase family protein [Arsenicicoccus piscis]|nr:flavin reductase family protein [Arsenicicoccus piscis]MCH8629026.1 flavin reductase family protein [Arsenicicoccus piscis]
MSRHEIDIASLPPGGAYRLLTASVVPRPIAWVSSRSATGVDNLAPHSFFTVVSADPPMVSFTSVGRKNTLDNVEATREFVVNVASEPMFEVINATSTDYPPDVSEFDAEGVEREASVTVAPPRVADSPVALECVLHQVIPMGDCHLVIGEVKHVAVSESVARVLEGGRIHPEIEALAPLSRLGRDQWGLLGEIRRIRRVPFSEKRTAR